MKTIAVEGAKGGVSKTTLCVNLAHALRTTSSADVLLIDTDPQMSASEWSDGCEPGVLGFPVIASPRPQLDKFVASIKLPNDFLLIDGAGVPASSPATIAGVRLADFVLMPVTPSSLDMWATGDLVELVKTRMDMTDGRLKAAFVITQALPRSRLARMVREALQQTGLPVLDTVIHRRKAYVEAVGHGTVFQQNDPAAKAEILGLTSEILALLHPAQLERAAA